MSTGASAEPMISYSDNSGVQLSKAEAEVYDRQIRLWGMEAQQNFIACSVFGWMGYSFFDFNNHLFLSAVEKKQDAVCDEDGGGSSSVPEAVDLDSENVFEKKMLQYPSFEDALNVDWSKKQLLRKSRRLIPCSYFPLKGGLASYGSRKEISPKIF
ncbi:hypothetical protein TELCIR_12294 [Teladorsagia circumcincta]|uniref:Uncharacterized protein n=1 Tax=Teladorsagia circumcincta TaxID=45464 RepID=A0A2G9U6Y1_TELCI|nr:hypothetical protein TELCIR_12294 [Teladorsagia circumcincta]